MSNKNNSQQDKVKQEKADRLSQALRENLRKRKAQARGRNAAKIIDTKTIDNDTTSADKSK